MTKLGACWGAVGNEGEDGINNGSERKRVCPKHSIIRRKAPQGSNHSRVRWQLSYFATGMVKPRHFAGVTYRSAGHISTHRDGV